MTETKEETYELDERSKQAIAKNPKIMKKWIEALRSGKYKQITGEMCDDTVENSACCLHVMEIECNDRKWEDGIAEGLPSDFADPLTLNANEDGGIHLPEKLELTDGLQPSSWNDTLLLSFEEIANILEHGKITKTIEVSNDEL